jgi:hypothetical protein
MRRRRRRRRRRRMMMMMMMMMTFTPLFPQPGEKKAVDPAAVDDVDAAFGELVDDLQRVDSTNAGNDDPRVGRGTTWMGRHRNTIGDYIMTPLDRTEQLEVGSIKSLMVLCIRV